MFGHDDDETFSRYRIASLVWSGLVDAVPHGYHVSPVR